MVSSSDKLVAIPSEGPVNELGTPGVPTVDALGRVLGRTYPELNDDIPDFLRSSAVSPRTATRDIKLFKDHTLDYPMLCLNVFVMPDPAVSDDIARFARMFVRTLSKGVSNIEEADIVVFGGGSDVDPVLYGEQAHNTTYANPDRDEKDMDVYLKCLEMGIPMFGVCRGAQFLHVMNGGKLIQDLDEHYGPHSMWDVVKTSHIDKVSSVHHQACLPNFDKGMTLLATTSKSTTRSLNNQVTETGSNADIEAFVYRDTCCIGVQGHPEYEGYNYYTKWCLELIEQYVCSNPDLAWTSTGKDGRLRMRPELIKERVLVEIPMEK